MEKRTDLALEATQLWQESAGKTSELKGVIAESSENDGFEITRIQVIDKDGADALGKPMGTYITVELTPLKRKDDGAFLKAAGIISDCLKELLDLKDNDSVMVACLGNTRITPDALGPQTGENTMATRHLTEKAPEFFGDMRRVSVIKTGVMGSTGMESASIISAVTEKFHPDKIIAVDALASRSLDRVCRTVQISDTGIVPGSGVGNSREALNKELLNTPVVALGVPTVVDAYTVAADVWERSGFGDMPDDLGQAENMVVTPRDIDADIAEISKLLGYSINMALHGNMSFEDMTMFLG